MDGQAQDILEAARDLVALWKAQKIEGLTRAQRNTAIDDARAELTKAVEAYEQFI